VDAPPSTLPRMRGRVGRGVPSFKATFPAPQGYLARLKAISAPPLGISLHFEDHGLTPVCSASPFRCGVTPKRNQRTNTIATKKTDKNADQHTRCEFHDTPAPARIPYYRVS
jgi:hypothetical protein